MARLSQWQITEITNKILDDLYLSNEEKLDKRKAELARKNREIMLAPLNQWIAKLPKELLNTEKTYRLAISYNMNSPIKKMQLQTKWETTFPNPVVNPPYLRYYSKFPKTNLVPELYEEAGQLCKDIIALRNEKQELTDYLKETTSNYSGSIQLRKVWPETLHKYLPVDNDKKTYKGKTIKTPPAFIPTRLVSNLLEK